MSIRANMVVKPMGNTRLIYRFVSEIFPQVKQKLAKWSNIARQCPDPHLGEQAVTSIRTKSFHCLGGSIYALYPGVNREVMVEMIVAYQTISDYLDNLVDSLNVHDEQAFRQLHLAMTEALDPAASISDYYLYYPYKNDGGYLVSLVETCRENINKLPSYKLVKDKVLWLAEQYSNLQTYKHLAPATREEKMILWLTPLHQNNPEVTLWELAAATGSTLGIFCLLAAASSHLLRSDEIEQIISAYFPWICGLHILLDYLIDLNEDRETFQLNFVQYYANEQEMSEHLHRFVQISLEKYKQLPAAGFQQAVVQGLLAMYLSDQKSKTPEIAKITKRLLKDGGNTVQILHWLCVQLRRREII